MTAAEIRRALREGVVDPFDLVCREGSQLRVEILEVDEIFTARQEEPEDGYTQLSSLPMAANAAPQPQYVHHIHHQSIPVSYVPKPIGQEDQQAARRKSLKKFYLIDRNHRVLGPLAAGEIQSLATRGIVGKGVLVQKMGDQRKVSLASFLRSYAQLNAGVRGVDLRSSRALNGVYRGGSSRRSRRNDSFFPYLMVILVGAILGFLVYFASHPQKDGDGRRVKHRQERRIQKRARGETQAPTLRRIAPKKEKSRNRAKPKVVTIERRAPVAVSVKREVKRVEGRREWPGNGVQKAKRETKKSVKEKRQVRAAPPKKREPERRPTPAPRPDPVVRAPIPVKKPVVAVAPRPEPAPAPKPTPPKPRPQPRPVAPPPKPAALVDGEVATLSAMSYSVSELDECPIKCKLRFSKSGLTVTAIFFKGAHLDALLAKNGSATISGRIKKQGGETQIFLESVR